MPKKSKLPKEFLRLVKQITNKRARVVIDHIIEHGFITTEELETRYGYNHPPRAARDVREAGIPLETFRIKSKRSNRTIAAYRFGDQTQLQIERIKGRIASPKKFKKQLYELSEGKCAICNGKFEMRYLQVDHRVPYQVAGDVEKERKLERYMLLCGSCNRAKSWSCEHCENWKSLKKPALCMQCYWGDPKHHSHVALKELRRLDLQWSGDEVNYYDAIKLIAEENHIELPEFVKKMIADETE